MSTPTPALRPNAQRAHYALLLLRVLLGLQVGLVLISLVELFLIDGMEKGTVFPDAVITGADSILAVFAGSYVIAYLVSVVIFIRWFRRAYFNLHLLPVRPMHSEGWAAGAWFVPIMNLLLPYQIMVELFRKSSRLIDHDPRATSVAPDYRLIGLWWGLWIVSNAFDRYAYRTSQNLETLADYTYSFQVDIVSYLLGIILTVLALEVVKAYASIERVLASLGRAEEAVILDSFGSR